MLYRRALSHTGGDLGSRDRVGLGLNDVSELLAFASLAAEFLGDSVEVQVIRRQGNLKLLSRPNFAVGRNFFCRQAPVEVVSQESIERLAIVLPVIVTG